MWAISYRTLIAAACFYGATFVVPTVNAAGLVERQDAQTQDSTVKAQAFTYDINAGAELQRDTANKPANVLTFTTDGGAPGTHPYAAQRIGNNGPVLLQDTQLIEMLSSLTRERIPERVVHAKGAGAHGYFVTTNSAFVKKYTNMDIFSQDGLRTPLTVRFSTVGGEAGSGDAARDLRGLAIKFRTRQGIWDLLTLSTPTFFIRDPAKFPSLIHAQKRHPSTHLKDNEAFWDYMSSNPESLFQVMQIFTDKGTPYAYRYMDAFAVNTYKWIQNDGTFTYVRLHFETMQGIRNLTQSDATVLQGTNPDFATQDLYDAIAAGDYPGWILYAQVMSPTEAENFEYNILDLTKQWSTTAVPQVEIGRMFLTQNPVNYFAEIELSGFAPSRRPPGFGFSADPALQARLFIYPDAQRYRLGSNYQQIPVNAPSTPVANFGRDGVMNVNGNQGSRPSLLSTEQPINLSNLKYTDDSHIQWTGGAVLALTRVTEMDFEWPRFLWGNLTQTDQDHLISNVVGSLKSVMSADVRLRQVNLFNHVDAALGKAIGAGVGVTPQPISFPTDSMTWRNVTVPTNGSFTP